MCSSDLVKKFAGGAGCDMPDKVCPNCGHKLNKLGFEKERKQFGRSISAFQNTQFELAEMKARVEAAKYLVYAAALKKQQAMDGAKVRYSVEAAQAKLIAARTASDVTRRCLQLFGGYGYTRDYPIERMMRDAKITEIYEGTSEVQMMVISSHA